MSLTTTTLFLFAFLIPGITFRFFVYFSSPVKRNFASSNTIHISVMVLLYSVFIHLITAAGFAAFEVMISIAYGADYLNQYITEYKDSLYFVVDGAFYSVATYATNFPFRVLSYFGLMLLMSYLAALAFKWAANHSMAVGRLLYGPLAPLLSTGKTDLLTCFVLTKIDSDNKRLIYAGYPIEINLKDGSNIDHIVLQNPEKFYLHLNRNYPKTSQANSRPISSQPDGSSLMYISGDKIENVHFEGWYFED